MTVRLPLDQMTISEKLAVMETLWEDLSRQAKGINSPEWHRDILHEREQSLRDGKASVMDWEKAKEEIRGRVA